LRAAPVPALRRGLLVAIPVGLAAWSAWWSPRSASSSSATAPPPPHRLLRPDGTSAWDL